MDKTQLDPLLEHFVNTGFKVGESQLKTGKEVIPQLTLLAEDEAGLTFAPIIGVDVLKDKIQKAVLYGWSKMRDDRSQLKLLAITFMSDVWLKHVSRPELIEKIKKGTFVPPSQQSDSVEAIVVQLTLEKEVWVYEWPYVRVGSDVVFVDKPEKSDIRGGFLPDLWPR
jgi:hypothetical protein